MVISLLGTFQVTLGGEPVTQFDYDKVRALLAYLAVEADRPHRRDALAALLWSEQPDAAARHSLRQALSKLRRLIGDRLADPPFLTLARSTVQCNPQSPLWVDVRVFRARLAASATHQHRHPAECDQCAEWLAEAAVLYRGNFLAGFSLNDSPLFDEWVHRQEDNLRQQALDALGVLAQYHERHHQFEQARHYARRQLALDPWREQAHRQLMRVLAFSGQRTAALAQYEMVRHLLHDEFDVEPAAETTALVQEIRQGLTLESPGPDAHSGQNGLSGIQGRPPAQVRGPAPQPDLYPSRRLNLPYQLTTFVGRKQELASVLQRLADSACRLLTVVGAGGAGKTRLAIQAANAGAADYRDGVVFVSLANVTSPAFVAYALADALKMPVHDQDDLSVQLASYLNPRQMLLLLDSFEHVVEAGDLFNRLLQAAPDIKFLATSQHPLHLRAEWLYDLHGMQVPASTRVDSVERFDAVQLFVDRARQVKADFVLDADNQADIVRICRQLDGMPLGIELAASWVRDLSTLEIARRISSDLDFLATALHDVPERHRSLRAVFERAWSLLPPEQRAAFGRLAVFCDVIEGQAAAYVALVAPPVLATLAAHSLLARMTADNYGMHELTRLYALEKLCEDPPQEKLTRDLHSSYYAAYVLARQNPLKGHQQKQALTELGAALGNILEGWEWALWQGYSDIVCRMVQGLYLYYDMRGRFIQGEETFARALRLLPAGPDDTDYLLARGEVMARLGMFAFRLNEHTRARHLLDESLAIFRTLHAPNQIALVLIHLGQVAAATGEHVKARQLFRHGLTLSHSLRDKAGEACALQNLGMTANVMGEYQLGREYFNESLALYREEGDERGIAASLNGLGYLALRRSDRAQARHLYRESLATYRELDDRDGITVCIDHLASMAVADGDYDRARGLYRENLHTARETGRRSLVLQSLTGLGEVDVAQGNLTDAAASLVDALGMALEIRAMPRMLDILVAVSRLLVRARRSERAVELLTLPLHHRASSTETRERAALLLNELRHQVPAERFGALQARAAQRGIDVLVAEVLGRDLINS